MASAKLSGQLDQGRWSASINNSSYFSAGHTSHLDLKTITIAILLKRSTAAGLNTTESAPKYRPIASCVRDSQRQSDRQSHQNNVT